MLKIKLVNPAATQGTTVNFLQKTVFQSNTVKYCPTLKFAHISATKRRRTESFGTNIGSISTHVCTNFQLKRLEPKADIVNKPENVVHELTDFKTIPKNSDDRNNKIPMTGIFSG